MSKNIVCIGGGYVGGPTMAVMAQKCPDFRITVIDSDPLKIEAWNSSTLPVHEPNLEDIIKEVRGKNLTFTTSLQPLEDADIIFIAVNTPIKKSGEGAGKAILVNYVEKVARDIGRIAKKPAIVVEKTTVPVGVSRSIRTVLNSNSDHALDFQIIANPDFFSEGAAVQGLLNPDRVLIGHMDSPEGLKAAQVIKDIYKRWVPEERILYSDVWSAELSKLTVSAFLAQRISSINSISTLCEKTGADVNEVARALGADSRIGPHFLQASVGFGGSSLKKDVLTLVYIAQTLGLEEVANYWEAVIAMNDYQIERFSRNIIHTLFDTLLNKKIAVFGFSFKSQTNDTREAPSITVCRSLLEEGAYLNIYDPVVSKSQILSDIQQSYDDINNPLSHSTSLNNIKELRTVPHSTSTNSFTNENTHTNTQALTERRNRYEDHITVFTNDPYEATIDTHAIIVLNDTSIFTTLDYQQIYNSMQKPAFIFDGRNILDRSMLRKIGFCTHGVGVEPDSLDSI